MLDIHNDLLLMIFSFLNVKDIFANVSLVSKEAYHLSKKRHFIKKIVIKNASIYTLFIHNLIQNHIYSLNQLTLEKSHDPFYFIGRNLPSSLTLINPFFTPRYTVIEITLNKDIKIILPSHRFDLNTRVYVGYKFTINEEKKVIQLVDKDINVIRVFILIDVDKYLFNKVGVGPYYTFFSKIANTITLKN
jgi:hypothetical protein